MGLSFEKKLTFGFGIAPVLLLLVSIVSYWSVTRLIDTTSWVAHIQEVRAELDDVPLQLARAKIAQQSYFLTGDEAYREQYHAAAVGIKKEIEDLGTLTHDDPTQQQRLRTIEFRATQYFTALQQEIDQWKEQKLSSTAQNLVAGKDISAGLDIDDLIEAMERDAQQQLKQRVSTADTSAASTSALIVLGNVLAIALSEYTKLF